MLVDGEKRPGIQQIRQTAPVAPRGSWRAMITKVIATSVFLTLLLPAAGSEPQALPPSSRDPSVRQLTKEQKAAVLKQTRFIRHPREGSFSDIDADFLQEVGLAPCISLDCCNAKYHLSPQFILEGGRPARVAYVEALGRIEAHLVYRSNSQSCWRLCDVLEGKRYGKGYYEFDIQLPIPVIAALHRLAEKEFPIELRRKDDQTSQRPSELVLRGLTEDASGGRKSGRLVPAVLRPRSDGPGRVPLCFVSRRYAERMPSYPERLSSIPRWLPTAGGRMNVTDPKSVALPEEDALPNVKSPEDRFELVNPMYATITKESGLLKGLVCRSRDKRFRYLFLEDQGGRAMLAAAELAEAPISELGLRCRYLDLAGLDAPLIEYGDQIPEQYGGRKGGGYQSNWPYVRELPIIKLYYREQGRSVP